MIARCVLQYALVDLHGCTHVTRMLLQADSAGERDSVQVTRSDKTVHSAFNNFLERYTLSSAWSIYVSSLVVVKL